MTSSPPPDAFVKAITFRRVLAAIRKSLNIAVDSGSGAQMPAGGVSVEFGPLPETTPFAITRLGDLISIRRGFITFAGRTLYFPTQTFSWPVSSGPFTLYLSHDVDFVATEVVIGELWEIIIDDAAIPELIVDDIGTLGAHAIVSTTPPAGASIEAIIVTPNTVLLPLVSWTGSRLVPHLWFNSSLTFGISGRAKLNGYF